MLTPMLISAHAAPLLSINARASEVKRSLVFMKGQSPNSCCCIELVMTVARRRRVLRFHRDGRRTMGAPGMQQTIAPLRSTQMNRAIDCRQRVSADRNGEESEWGDLTITRDEPAGRLRRGARVSRRAELLALRPLVKVFIDGTYLFVLFLFACLADRADGSGIMRWLR